jgi:hypothetical protein
MSKYSESLKSTSKLSKDEEESIINKVAKEYGLDDNATKLLHGIRHVENGKQGREFGVLNSHAERYANDPDPSKSFKLQAQWAAGTIKNHYKGDLDKFADRYAPTKGATNDVHGLNQNWLANMKDYLGDSNGSGS